MGNDKLGPNPGFYLGGVYMTFYQYLNFTETKSYVGRPFMAQTGTTPVRAYHIDRLTIDGSKLGGELWREVEHAVSLYNANLTTNKDPAIQVLLHVLKMSDFWDRERFDRDTFIIKVQESGQRFTVELVGGNIVFRDLDIWSPKAIKFRPTTDLYHTPYINNLKYLNPSMGGLGTHSIYCEPRIYCTSFPTTAGDWPLFKKDAWNAVKGLEMWIKKDPQKALKFIVKWIAHGQDLYIYKLNVRPTEVYLDPEAVQDKGSPNVYYINSQDSIPVQKVDPDAVVDYEFLAQSPILRSFMDQHPEIGSLVGEKIKEHKRIHPQRIYERTKWRDL